MLATLQAKLGLLAAVALLAFGTGWTVNGWRWEAKHAAELTRQIDEHTKAEQDAAFKSAGLEIQLELARRNARDINRRLAHETAKPDYRCPVPADGLRLRAAAVAGGAAGEHDGPVRTDP